MAVDISLIFLDFSVASNRLADVAAKVSDAHRIILCIGSSPNRISLWSDGRFDIEAAACLLSESGSVCLVWKVEHADLAGWSTFKLGKALKRDLGPSDPILRDAIRIVESLLETSFGLDDFWGFPDVLIDETMMSLQLSKSMTGYEILKLPQDTVINLLEGDLPLESVLPLDVSD